MRGVRDLVLTDGDQVFRAADHAGRRAANLEMRNFAYGLELEHEVKGRDFEHADIRKIEHLCYSLNDGLRHPPFLFLRPPQKRNDGRGLTTLRIFANLRLGPFLVFRRESETVRLFGMKAAKH